MAAAPSFEALGRRQRYQPEKHGKIYQRGGAAGAEKIQGLGWDALSKEHSRFAVTRVSVSCGEKAGRRKFNVDRSVF